MPKTSRCPWSVTWFDMTIFLLHVQKLLAVLVQVNQHFQETSTVCSLSRSDLLKQRKTNQIWEGLWQQLETLVFKWRVPINAFKWMQIFMRGTICRAEYSCGYQVACPHSGQRKAAFLSPSLFWHADKEAKKQGDSKVRVCPGVQQKLPDTEKWARIYSHFCWCQTLPIRTQLI